MRGQGHDGKVGCLLHHGVIDRDVGHLRPGLRVEPGEAQIAAPARHRRAGGFDQIRRMGLESRDQGLH